LTNAHSTDLTGAAATAHAAIPAFLRSRSLELHGRPAPALFATGQAPSPGPTTTPGTAVARLIQLLTAGRPIPKAAEPKR